MFGSRALTIVGLGLVFGTPSAAQQTPPAGAAPQVQRLVQIESPYAAYEFLIGEWDARPAGGPDNSIRQVFRWGPRQSYIFYTTFVRAGDRPEAIHFEGMMIWNGATRALDYIIAVEPGSGTQESGTMRVEADGSWVRDVLMTQASGRTARFRQTFRRTGRDSATTALMRQTADGWEPTFPGSDRLEMTRRRT